MRFKFFIIVNLVQIPIVWSSLAINHGASMTVICFWDIFMLLFFPLCGRGSICKNKNCRHFIKQAEDIYCQNIQCDTIVV